MMVPQKLNRSILLSQVINDAGKWTILTCKKAEGTMTLQNINLSFPVEQDHRGLVLTPEEVSSTNL